VTASVHHHRGEQAVDPAGGGHLLPEAAAEVGIGGELGPDGFDGDRAPACGKAEEHAAHAAAAKLPDQPVRAYRLRVPRLQCPDHVDPTQRRGYGIGAKSDRTTICTALGK
jgi:hypothetical protein